jgi:hypothetical protein
LLSSAAGPRPPARDGRSVYGSRVSCSTIWTC